MRQSKWLLVAENDWLEAWPNVRWGAYQWWAFDGARVTIPIDQINLTNMNKYEI